MGKKYSIELTEKQLRVIADALEFYSRFLAGQWEIPDAMEFKEYKLQDKYIGFWEKRNFVEEQFKILKSNFTGLPIHASYGIGSDKLHEDAKIAYDIYRPILEQFAKERKEENSDNTHYSVYDSPGLTYSKEGRININVNNEKDR